MEVSAVKPAQGPSKCSRVRGMRLRTSPFATNNILSTPSTHNCSQNHFYAASVVSVVNLMTMSTNSISQSGDFRFFTVTGAAVLVFYLLVWIYNQLSPFDRQLRLALHGRWKLPPGPQGVRTYGNLPQLAGAMRGDTEDGVNYHHCQRRCVQG